MSVARSCYVKVGCVLAVALLATSGMSRGAPAAECAPSEFGTLKAHVRFILSDSREDFVLQLRSYAKRNGLVYDSIRISDPSRQPPNTLLQQMLETSPREIEMTVMLDELTNAGEASISTYACHDSDGWKPYWRSLRAFLRSQHLNTIPRSADG